MLRFAIANVDLHQSWRRHCSDWRGGRSWVQSFEHPALETLSARGCGSYLFVVREALAGRPWIESWTVDHELEYSNDESFNRLWAETVTWPLDWISVRISERDGVRINAGALGIAPVYVVAKDGLLRGSWDPVELYPYMPTSPLDEERVAHYLVSFSHPYSRRTVFSDLFRITERAQLHWNETSTSHRRFAIDYPRPVLLPRPQKLKPHSEPVSAFSRILTESLSRRLIEGRSPIGAHLSGGLDSAICAATAANLKRGQVHTYGLILDDGAGHTQRSRRQELVHLFQFRDLELNAFQFPPFAQCGRRMREQRVVPWGECYDEAFEQILDVAALEGTPILLQGTGGDELLYAHWEELSEAERDTQRRHALPNRGDVPKFLTSRAYDLYRDTYISLDRAPLSPIPTSALEDCCCGAPPCLRYGVWPIHPLCTPELASFCRSLPRRWRNERALLRQSLQRLGCSRKVTHPMTSETFAPLMANGLRITARSLLQEIFRESILAELGLVDGSALIAAYDEYCTESTDQRGAPYYAVAVLELALRACHAKAGDDPLVLDNSPT